MLKVGERHFAANPPAGFGPYPNGPGRTTAFCQHESGRKAMSMQDAMKVRSTLAAVGSLRLATVGAGPMTRLGYSSKSGGVNSSTMKGR